MGMNLCALSPPLGLPRTLPHRQVPQPDPGVLYLPFSFFEKLLFLVAAPERRLWTRMEEGRLSKI